MLSLDVEVLQRACGVCFWKVDLATSQVSTGPGWDRLLGLDSEHIPTSLAGWLDLFHPVDRAEVEAVLQLPRTGGTTVLEVRLRHRDGQWRWIRLKASAVDDQSLVGLGEEITESKLLSLRNEERRRAAEEALLRSEELYRGLYEHSTEHLFSVAVDENRLLRYEGLNPAHQRATGLKESDLAGREPSECLPPEVARHVEANYRRCLEEGRVIAYEEVLELPNGRITWMTQLIPLRNREGRIFRLFGICTDLTRLKDRERALRLAQRQESIGKLASGIAHDFNNLLTVIVCQLDLMKVELLNNPEMEEVVDEICEAARRAGELTRGLLNLSKPAEGERSSQDLLALVRRFQRILKNLVGQHISLRYELEAVAPVLAAPVQIDQLLLNLVGNAADSLGEKRGTITLRLAEQTLGEEALRALLPGQALQPGTYVTLEVTDDGPGVNPDLLPRIFEPRVSSKGDGRGLGLATVRNIVEEMRGGVSVRSQPGEGTSFKFFFPPAQAPAQAPVLESWTCAPSLSGRVLFASSDTALRRTLRDLFERMGLDCEEAAQTSELVSLLAISPARWDVVVIDVLREVELEPLFSAVTAVRPELPVLILSALPAGELLLKSTRPMPVGFLHKPFEPGELEKALARLLVGNQ